MADRRTDAGRAAHLFVADIQHPRGLLVPACAALALVWFLAAVTFACADAPDVAGRIAIRCVAFAPKPHRVSDYRGARGSNRPFTLFPPWSHSDRDPAAAILPVSCISSPDRAGTFSVRLDVAPPYLDNQRCDLLIDPPSRRSQNPGVLAANEYLRSNPRKSFHWKRCVHRSALAGVFVSGISSHPCPAR